ncbi:MAG: YbfB/YjiJ family MFS transporter, partial [bacterium]|nr:YbfB/YjiJ family MFS transporter [bacterium]
MRSPRASFGTILGALVAIAAAMGFGRFAYTQLLPPMVAQLRLSDLDAAWMAAANFVGYLLGALAGTHLCARLNERRVAFGGMLALALTLAATPLLGLVPWLVTARLVAGIESAVIFVAMGILVFETMARSTAMIAFGGVGAGIFLSAAFLAPLVARGPWQRGWYAIALAALLAALTTWRLVPRVQTRVAVGISIAPGIGLRLVDASYFFQGIGYIVFATFAVLYLVERGDSHAVASAAWLAVGLGACVGPWLSGVVAARVGTKAALTLFQLVEATATIVFALAPPLLAIPA